MSDSVTFRTLLIPNVAEAFKGLLERIPPGEERLRRTAWEHDLSGRALLWGGDQKIIVTPYSIDPVLIEQVNRFNPEPRE